MAKKDFEAALNNIDDEVSTEEENAVQKTFSIFSDGVKTITKEVNSHTVEALIKAIKKNDPYLSHAKILNYTSSWSTATIQPYKNFEVKFQRVTVRLHRDPGEWIWLYELT